MKKTILMALIIGFFVSPITAKAQNIDQINNDLFIAQRIIELQKQIDELTKIIDSILKNTGKNDKKTIPPQPILNSKPCNALRGVCA